MARGPKPKPAAIRDQLKPVRSKRKPAQAAAPDLAISNGSVGAPDWLSEDGRAIWNKEAPPFMQARLLGRTDVVSFARWCETLANWLRLKDILATAGEFYTVASAHGTYTRPHPAGSRMDRLEVRLVALEDRFGGNPSARQRIVAARANTPIGGLFDDKPGASPDPTAAPEPVKAEDSPTGFLN